MMEAVAQKKANWLFRSGSDKTFSGRRPQEDMVTSAIFGSIRLMSTQDRREALAVLLGRDFFLECDDDINIFLWPSLSGSKDRRRVEPDVLLVSDGQTVIVEVKWHAPLSDMQVEQQVEAVKLSTEFPDAKSVVVLGDAKLGDASFDLSKRTWRDVSGSVQSHPKHPPRDDVKQSGLSAFEKWLLVMHQFLQQTDMGRIFNGLEPIEPPAPSTHFAFAKPGHPPWFASEQHSTIKTPPFWRNNNDA